MATQSGGKEEVEYPVGQDARQAGEQCGVAADRLVHHSMLFELNVESYRRRTAIEAKRGPGRPAVQATPKNAHAATRPEIAEPGDDAV